jgi:hypothetical protein
LQPDKTEKVLKKSGVKKKKIKLARDKKFITFAPRLKTEKRSS